MTISIYETITNQIVAAIKEGTSEYRMPWHRGSTLPRNILTGKPYRGINILALWQSATTHDFRSCRWGTFKQWASKGARVRRGERATQVVLWKQVEKQKEEGEHNNEHKHEGSSFMFATHFNVFNADQVDGLEPVQDEHQEVDQLSSRAFFRALPGKVVHLDSRAFYSLNGDFINMPPIERFTASHAYWSVLAHEYTHWTGHPTRLHRELSTRFGSESYAFEELIAELGSAFISALLNIPVEPRHDHAGYIDNWLTVLNRDCKAIFSAAAYAQRATDYLFSLHSNRQQQAA